MRKLTIFFFLLVLVLFSGLSKAVISGNPASDGYLLVGNSLEKGMYVDGSANYGFDSYVASFVVSAGSQLQISDGENSWLANDVILSVGGIFNSNSPSSWNVIGNPVNSLLTSASSGPKLQAKFGTSAASWVTSTTAPGSGNASGSGSLGGGRVQIRTGTYYTSTATDPGWSTNAGQLLPLAKDSHIEWDNGSVNRYVARMIWTYDSLTGKPGSWELFLNTSLIARLNPTYTGLLPSIGNKAIVTVQNNDSAYTNALVFVPEPATLAILALGGLLIRRKKAN